MSPVPRTARRFACAVATALALAAVPGAVFAQHGAAPAATTGPVTPRVTVAPVTEMEIVAQVPVSGSLLPRTEILVYPQVSGYIINSISVEVGDMVEAGQELARMNAQTLAAEFAKAEAEQARAQAAMRQAQSQIASAEASQSQADAALERTQRLATSGSVSTAALDDARAAAETARAATASAIDGLSVAEAAVRQAEAQAGVAQLNLDNAVITAPVAGLVSARNAQPGAITAMGGDPLFKLIEGGEIEVEAEVIETALASIAVDDEVRLEIAGIGPVEGRVRQISPVVDQATRLGMLRIAIPPQTGLREGLFASGSVVTDRRQGLTVPSSAVLSDLSGKFVLRVEDDVLHHTEVTAGLLFDDRREIVSGLDADAIVVQRAGSFFGDGDIVRPVMAGTEDAPEVGAPDETASAAEAPVIEGSSE